MVEDRCNWERPIEDYATAKARLAQTASELEKKRWRDYLASLVEEKKRIRAVQHAKDAKAAAVDNRVREHAWLVKQQLERHKSCPYCGGVLGTDAHADHIYPVALGGLSTPENIVVVCTDCNKKKGAMTLREFIESYGLDRARIETTLKQLGKKF